MAKLAFVGLGVMGFPMARHLAAAGHEVTVYTRTAKKADDWVAKHKGAKAATPAAAAKGADIVLTMVGNDDDLRSVVYGEKGVLAGMTKGAILLDHTTASAFVAREIDAEAQKKGIGFLDAPVSGGQAGAENAQLGIMVGGDPAVFAKAEPVMKIYAKALTLIGPTGAGQLTKMVNQICIASLVQGLSEGMNFAVKSGLDPEKVLSVITAGAAGSWQMQNRAKTMVQGKFDFGFAVDWMRKDLSICLEESKRNKARLPATALVDQFYAQVQARGGGRWDTSSLIHLLAND
jgi:3-hydroxyisobutyrate dehydrogenase